MAFDRDPFAWVSLLGNTFDIFINYEVEGNIGWLLEQFRTCFRGNPGTQHLGEAMTTGTLYNPGVIAGERVITHVKTQATRLANKGFALHGIRLHSSLILRTECEV